MKRYLEFFLHISFWALFGIYYFKTVESPFTGPIVLLNSLTFYVNILILFPLFLNKNKYLGYFVYLFFWVLAVATLLTWISYNIKLDYNIPFHLHLSFVVNVGVQLLFFIPLAFLYKFVRDYLLYKKIDHNIEIGIIIFSFAFLWWQVFDKLGFHGSGSVRFFVSIAFNTLFVFTHFVLFFGNAFLLIPNFLARKKEGTYTISLVALLISVISVNYLLSYFHQIVFEVNTLNNYFEWSVNLDLFVITSLSFLYKFTKDWISNEKEKQELITEKSRTELAFLKTQVNPHFLFNSLNTLYGTALVEKAEKTADGISSLGSLMRYMMHDSNKDFVPLDKELEYIKNYVELQRKRISTQHNISIFYDCEGDSSTLEISPVILIPLIENAFKHGISLQKETSISIQINITGSTIHLFVKNSNHSLTNKEPESGLGLENVRKRLQLVYPGKYQIDINKTRESFIVELKIDLKR